MKTDEALKQIHEFIFQIVAETSTRTRAEIGLKLACAVSEFTEAWAAELRDAHENKP